MKIKNIITQDIYEYTPEHSGENKSICPTCSSNRKKSKVKCWSWNYEKQSGFCSHCEAMFYPAIDKKEKKEYFIPEWNNKTNLSDVAVKWFNGRKITQPTLNKMNIYTENGYIHFPYFYNNIVKNIKSRDKNKSFLLVKDAERIFYNLDCVKEYDNIIITEGEIDALSFIEVGLNNVISVPNGASTSCDYLDDYIDLFENKTISIAVDYDNKGLILRNELIRRFGSEMCYLIKFKDCKDANEYLMKYGSLALQDAYNSKEQIPVEGIIDLEKSYDDIYSLYVNGMQKGKEINDKLDEYITWETGRLCVVTGIPNHGKSEYVDEIIVKLNHLHNWKVGIFSPENYPVKYHIQKIVSKISGLPFNTNKLSLNEFNQCIDYIHENFFFIYPEKDFNIDTILSKMKYLIKKHGIKTIVLDPYNKFEHQRKSGETETEYISKFLDKLVTFAQKNDVLIFLVAHPVKMPKDKNNKMKYEVPTLYDISGSAHFANKTDFGLSIYRDYDSGLTDIHILKVKFKHLGIGGILTKKYNYINGRFEHENSSIDQWSANSIFSQIDNSLQPNFDFSQINSNIEAPY